MNSLGDRQITSFCGDLCSECPRYLATITNDIPGLKNLALLWFKLEFRDEIGSPEEIKCNGGSKTKMCSHNINSCEHSHNLSNRAPAKK